MSQHDFRLLAFWCKMVAASWETLLSDVSTWRKGLQKLRRLCQGTCMLVPKYCVFCEFTAAVRKMYNLSKAFSCYFGWTRQISPWGIYISRFQIGAFFAICSQHLSFQGAGGWRNHGQQGKDLHNRERQCGEIWVACARIQVAFSWRCIGFGAGFSLLRFLRCASRGPGGHVGSVATPCMDVVSFALAQGPK